MSKEYLSYRNSCVVAQLIFCLSFTVGAMACDDSDDGDEKSNGSGSGGDGDGEGSGEYSPDDLTLPYVVYDYRVRYSRTASDEEPFNYDLNGEVILEDWGSIKCSEDSNSVHLEYVSTIYDCDAHFKVGIAAAVYSGAGIYRNSYVCEGYDDSSWGDTDAELAVLIPVVYEGECIGGYGTNVFRPVRGEFNWDHNSYCNDYNASTDSWRSVDYSYDCEVEIIDHTAEKVLGKFSCRYTYNYVNDVDYNNLTEKATVTIDGEFAYNPAECD